MLHHHSIEVQAAERLVITRFGVSEAHAVPHDTAEYRAHAVRSGVGENVNQYCLDHDLVHSWFGEAVCGGYSPVLRSVAIDQDVEMAFEQDQLDREEEIVKLLQGYFNRYGWPTTRAMWPL